MSWFSRARYILLLQSVMLFECAEYAHGSEVRNDFRIVARICEAMEGGPFVVEVTYFYQGREAIEITVPGEMPRTYVTEKVPSHWKEHSRSFLLIGPAQCVEKLLPGQKWSEILYLHHYYSNITSGSARIQLTWNVRATNSKDKLIACPRAILNLNVPQANPANLDALRRRLSKKITEGKLSSNDREYLVKQLQHTNHHELESVAWQLLESNEDSDLTYQLAYWIYDTTKSPDQVHTRLVKMALDPKRHDAAAIFAVWRAKVIPLPAALHARCIRLPLAERTRLAHAANLWTRTLVYVTYPDVCDKDWSAALMRDLRNIGTPSVAPSEIERTLREVDDDSFLVRDKASARVEQLGERIEVQLRQALQKDLSPEAKRRVRTALDKITSKPSTIASEPDCAGALDYLFQLIGTPQADALLDTLAHGDPPLRFTQYIKAELRERRKRLSGR